MLSRFIERIRINDVSHTSIFLWMTRSFVACYGTAKCGHNTWSCRAKKSNCTLFNMIFSIFFFFLPSLTATPSKWCPQRVGLTILGSLLIKYPVDLVERHWTFCIKLVTQSFVKQNESLRNFHWKQLCTLDKKLENWEFYHWTCSGFLGPSLQLGKTRCGSGIHDYLIIFVESVLLNGHWLLVNLGQVFGTLVLLICSFSHNISDSEDFEIDSIVQSVRIRDCFSFLSVVIRQCLQISFVMKCIRLIADQGPIQSLINLFEKAIGKIIDGCNHVHHIISCLGQVSYIFNGQF